MSMTPEQAQAYIDIINASAKKAQGSLPRGTEAASAQDIFCQGYTDAKPLLEQMATLIAWWPSYGALASTILKGLLALADDIHDAGCPTQPPAP